MFVYCGISGFVYDFVPYGGEDTLRKLAFTDEEKQNFGFCNQVVISLSKTVTNPAYSVLYFDNYFSSPDLMHYLRNKKGMLALGTLRSNRSRQYEIKSDKELRQQGRGSFCQKIDNINKVTIVKWYDNKSVLMCSSYCDAYPLSTIKGYVKSGTSAEGKTAITCPKVIKYLAGMLIALYRSLKTHRWYMSIFSQILDICVNNAWLLY